MPQTTTEKKRVAAGEPEGLIEQIRSRAFEIFQHRGGGGGSAMADWLEAEFDLVCRRASELSELRGIAPKQQESAPAAQTAF
ncbi:MAG: DUF2934 domain-containing protein [Bryobacteraceae bacterium]|jgi:hypothetical protein